MNKDVWSNGQNFKGWICTVQRLDIILKVSKSFAIKTFTFIKISKTVVK